MRFLAWELLINRQTIIDDSLKSSNAGEIYETMDEIRTYNVLINSINRCIFFLEDSYHQEDSYENDKLKGLTKVLMTTTKMKIALKKGFK